MIGQMVTWICLDFGDPYLYFVYDMDRFQTLQHLSGGFEKRPEKPGD